VVAGETVGSEKIRGEGRGEKERGPGSGRRPARLPPRAAPEEGTALFCGKSGGVYRFCHPEVERR